MPSPDALTFAEVFPADDKVAQMVVSVCLARNDLYFINQELLRRAPDTGAVAEAANAYLLRLSLGHLHEFAAALSGHLIDPACKALVDMVISTLDAQERDAVRGVIDGQGVLGNLNRMRNRAAFHYPRPGDGSGAALGTAARGGDI